jgi:hypothetical protein
MGSSIEVQGSPDASKEGYGASVAATGTNAFEGLV